ncbi:MAG: methyltransferase domain-containing protein [Candidatus Methanoperedens sp.]|nr:methyltransferase domain-containing protein [Candidatus Methanoperedens sp.]
MTGKLQEEYRDAILQNSEESLIFGPKGEYWGIISQNNEDFIFPSPVNLSGWLDDTADWLGEGTSILEIGPGKAVLAGKVLSGKRNAKNYFIADISEGILNYAREQLGQMQSPIKTHFIRGDLNTKNPLREIKAGSLDRVILVNVFGYLDPDIALSNIHRLLPRGGLLRLTVGDHEAFTRSEDYDPNINRQYVRGRKFHADAKIEPLGYTVSADGKKVPFYGYRRNYSKEEIETLLDKNGFATEQFKVVVIPKELWLKVRSLQSNFRLNQEEEKLLEKYGGRPIWDIIARKK